MAQQLWVTNSLGGNLTNNKLSKQLREQALPMFVYRQFAQIKDEGLGRQAGDTIYYDKVLRINTRGGTLAETSTVPANLVKIQKDSVQIAEWGNAIKKSVAFKKLGELLETLNETISSQAAPEWAEGSETRVNGPERAMELHERLAA